VTGHPSDDTQPPTPIFWEPDHPDPWVILIYLPQISAGPSKQAQAGDIRRENLIEDEKPLARNNFRREFLTVCANN
jgi:hypothetical protein